MVSRVAKPEAAVLLVLLAAFILHIWRLGVPPKIVFDEVYYVKAARSILRGGNDSNWVHPPLGKVLIGASILALGDRPAGWRFASVLASTLAAGFFFLLARELFGSARNALTASALYLCDGITYVQGRLAMLDIFMLAFLLPAVYFFIKRRYALASLFWGLSLSCKWPALFILPLFAVWPAADSAASKKWRTLLQLILPAFLAYFLLFRLFSFSTHLTVKGFSMRGELKTESMMFRRQWDSLKFYLRPAAQQHPYAAPWWKLILFVRPIWYFAEKPPKAGGILVLPNPLLWGPALLAWAGLFFRLRNPAARFIFWGGLCFTLPWAALRTGGFMYYLLPLSPFLVLALVWWIRDNVKAQAAAVLWCLLGFAFFFPVYSAIPVSRRWLAHLLWLKSWV